MIAMNATDEETMIEKNGIEDDDEHNIEANEDDVGLSIAIIQILGTIGMFILPPLLTTIFKFTDMKAGILCKLVYEYLFRCKMSTLTSSWHPAMALL